MSLFFTVLLTFIAVAQAGCPTGWVANGALCYYVVDSSGGMTQSDAQEKCEDLGGDLPIITSAAENSFIVSLATGNGDPWLGMQAQDDGEFYWENCTPVADTFSNWNTGEPNNPSDERCAYMYVNGGHYVGKWNNNPCDKSFFAICQKPM